jgi:hypothetical protein
MKVKFNFGSKLSIRMEQISLNNSLKAITTRQSGKTEIAIAFIRTKIREINFARKI